MPHDTCYTHTKRTCAMTKKLTLTVSDQVITAAKRYAHERETSVSSLVENYLQLITKNQLQPLVPKTSIAARFAGIGGRQLAAEEDPKAEWLDHLSEKHG